MDTERRPLPVDLAQPFIPTDMTDAKVRLARTTPRRIRSWPGQPRMTDYALPQQDGSAIVRWRLHGWLLAAGEPAVSRVFCLRFALALALIMGAGPVLAGGHQTAAADTQSQLAATACTDLRAAAKLVPGDGPMLLASYPTVRIDGPAELRALANVGYVYDNAVTGIALAACGQPGQERRIADALVGAPAHDTAYQDGRLRNAYQAGAVGPKGLKLPGYWDASKNLWTQDAYQVSTATGNLAWAALLFLDVYSRTRDARYLDAAVAQLRWIDGHVTGTTAPAGDEGGVFGFDGKQQAQHWKSTEQNLDVYAAAAWALRYYPADAALKRQARIAGSFVRAMHADTPAHFYIGTLDDGRTISRDLSGLDAQVWPLLAFPGEAMAWSAGWAWTESHHGIGGGYGFSREPDALWTEGTAQAADAMQASGRPVPAALWSLLMTEHASAGLFYATPKAVLHTHLAIGPTSTQPDFYYYHLPHLGATGWAALAAKGWDPFTGQKGSVPGVTPRTHTGAHM